MRNEGIEESQLIEAVEKAIEEENKRVERFFDKKEQVYKACKLKIIELKFHQKLSISARKAQFKYGRKNYNL